MGFNKQSFVLNAHLFNEAAEHPITPVLPDIVAKLKDYTVSSNLEAGTGTMQIEKVSQMLVSVGL